MNSVLNLLPLDLPREIRNKILTFSVHPNARELRRYIAEFVGYNEEMLEWHDVEPATFAEFYFETSRYGSRFCQLHHRVFDDFYGETCDRCGCGRTPREYFMTY